MEKITTIGLDIGSTFSRFTVSMHQGTWGLGAG